MRSDDPYRKRPEKPRPEIWASGGQRPPFDLRALARGTLYLAREAVAPLQGWAARKARRVAVNVQNGAGRIPAGKLGRAERFVPSHQRVAGWIANLATTFAHASATADVDIPRGNALVAAIRPHLWADIVPTPVPDAAPTSDEIAPVILPEPEPEPEPEPLPQAEADPLASIRGDLGPGRARPEATARPRPSAPRGPDVPPAPPGPVADMVMQVTGYLIGWASVGLLLPYGLVRALWLWAGGRDLKGIGRED